MFRFISLYSYFNKAFVSNNEIITIHIENQ